MQFPQFPEALRKYARAPKKISDVMRVIGILGVVLSIVGFKIESEYVWIVGFIFALLGVASFPLRIESKNAFLQVRIDENGVSVVDDEGDVLRSSEYRYVRNAEVRDIEMTWELGNDKEDNPGGGVKTKLIMVYINCAFCFEDLNLQRLGRRDHIFYRSTDILFNHNCIAFEYNEEAWNLLQEMLQQAGVSIPVVWND